MFAPDSRFRGPGFANIRLRIHLKCPHCGTTLIRESMILLSTFQCPKCNSELRISRGYRVAATVLAGAISLTLCLLRGADGLTLPALWLALSFILYSPIAFLLATVFPPKVVDADTNSFEIFHR